MVQLGLYPYLQGLFHPIYNWYGAHPVDGDGLFTYKTG